MKPHYIREIKPEEVITSFFLVKEKEVRQKRSGEPYLTLTLADKTGTLDARMWDGVVEVAETFDRDDFVKTKGLVQIFHNRPQMTVHKLRRVEDHEVDFADYFPHTTRDVGQMWAELRAGVGAMAHPQLRALLEAFLDDEHIAGRFRAAPAAKTLHHATIGGLLEHVVSLLHLARLAASHYHFLDSDLLLAGVVLHDIGKIYELDYQRTFRYSTQGQLLGHMVIALDLLRAKAAALPDFPPRLKVLLEHLILSHHGQYEFGSPRLPAFPEAMALHLLDNLDSKLESMRASIEGDPNIEGEWTGYNPSLERALLKKDRYLNPPPATPPPPAPAETQPQRTLFGGLLEAAIQKSDGSEE